MEISTFYTFFNQSQTSRPVLWYPWFQRTFFTMMSHKAGKNLNSLGFKMYFTPLYEGIMGSKLLFFYSPPKFIISQKLILKKSNKKIGDLMTAADFSLDYIHMCVHVWWITWFGLWSFGFLGKDISRHEKFVVIQIN